MSNQVPNYPNYQQPYDMPKNKSKKPFWIILIALVLVTTNVLTFFVTRYFPLWSGSKIVIDAGDDVAAKSINKMLFLRDQLDENFLWEIDEQEMWDSAIKGLMNGTGDQYSGYMTPDEYADYKQATSGTFYGIGVSLTNNADGNVEITKVYANSPAERAKLQIGDIIIGASDQSLIGMTTDEAVTYIKGENGTSVQLTIRRGTDEFTVSCKREAITITYVEYEMLESKIGYISISSFEGDADDQFMAALSDLQSQGMKGLILDLRQNLGGSVDQACKIADALLPECEIIYTLDKQGNKKSYTSDASSAGVPVVCLIDEYSASSAEILTIALKDNNACTIVGTKSYGKGIMQVLIPLSDGSMYKYTFCEYYGPKGSKIHDVGITPDVVVEREAKHKNKAIASIPKNDDAQLAAAIAEMKKKI